MSARGRTRRALALAGVLAAAFAVANCQSCPSGPPSPNTPIYYALALGNQSNFVNLRRDFFLGHRVERFRLRVRFVNPGRSAQWLPGITLSFVGDGGFQQLQGLPAGAAADGSFWTDEFTANRTEIRIGSGGIVDFEAGQPRFEILEVERHFDPGIDREAVPVTSSTVDPAFARLLRGDDVIGFSPGVVETQHYLILSSLTPRQAALYLSPFLLSTHHDMGIKIHLSTTGFVAWDAPVNWIEPSPGDSGIYHEFTQGNQHTFVTVVSTLIGPYLIRYNWLVERFDGIVMERDEQMGAAPDIDLDALRAGAGQGSPYNAQLADFLRGSADFDRRIRETLAVASAFALDGSNGQMRYRGAELHRDIATFRNVDVQFAICDDAADPDCRANTSWTRISMFTLDLTDPVGAGWTFHHEWGHWDYGLPDEYLDVAGPPPALSSLAIDPNSLMGTAAATEFCTPDNHRWAEDAGGEEDSSWTQIEDQYGDVDPGAVAFSRLSQARYLDVLNNLNARLQLTVH